MESAEPSDFVCLKCNLRFKNARSFENHKRKFCQLQKGRNDSSLQNARGFVESAHAGSPIKMVTGDDFWNRNPAASRNGLRSEGRYEVCKANFLVHMLICLVHQLCKRNILKRNFNAKDKNFV